MTNSRTNPARSHRDLTADTVQYLTPALWEATPEYARKEWTEGGQVCRQIRAFDPGCGFFFATAEVVPVPLDTDRVRAALEVFNQLEDQIGTLKATVYQMEQMTVLTRPAQGHLFVAINELRKVQEQVMAKARAHGWVDPILGE